MFTTILDTILGPVCPACEKRSQTVKVVRSFAALYHTEKMNWFTGCKPCRMLHDLYCEDILSERLEDRGIC